MITLTVFATVLGVCTLLLLILMGALANDSNSEVSFGGIVGLLAIVVAVAFGSCITEAVHQYQSNNIAAEIAAVRQHLPTAVEKTK